MSTSLKKDLLRNLYVVRKLSTWAIGEKLKVSRSRVYLSLKRYGIPIRTIAEAHVRYPRSDFSGELCEKAYLLGFAIGDLRVRNHNGDRSETISIACGSTRPAQIKLIQQLFSKYGRVWEGVPDKRGAVNIEAFVNKSFSFLLPVKRDYLWCAKYKEHFFSFLAGFTDAEGSFYISQNKAFLSWGNYDLKILHFIKSGMEKYGIATPKIYSDSLKGYIGTQGYVRKENYHHLTCSRKIVLHQLLEELSPFLRHEEKKKRMVHIRKNLIMRGTDS